MLVDGPHPENPFVGELAQIAVPVGVGVKIVNSTDDVYLTAFTSISGGANFTINEPGEYTLVIGEISSEYWGMNKTLTVLGKATPDIKFTPENAVIGEALTIKATAQETPVADAFVTVTAPDGSFDTLVTSSSGEVVYTPASVGKYSVKVEKKGISPESSTFEAYNGMRIEFIPARPNVGEEVTLTVRNQMGGPVSDASVLVDDIISGVTDELGKFRLNLTEDRSYNISVRKSRYWDAIANVTTKGGVFLKIEPELLEAGGSATVSVVNACGKRTEGIIEVLGPGIMESVVGDSYAFTPKVAGNYTVSVFKEGYNESVVSGVLTVEPHPIKVEWKVDGKNLVLLFTIHEQPAAGINVGLRGPVELNITTGNDGRIIVPLNGSGVYYVDVNKKNANPEYETKTESREIAKEYDYPILIAIILAVVGVVIIILVGVLFYRRIRGYGGGSLKAERRSSLSRR